MGKQKRDSDDEDDDEDKNEVRPDVEVRLQWHLPVAGIEGD